jgi:hypothetical protein
MDDARASTARPNQVAQARQVRFPLASVKAGFGRANHQPSARIPRLRDLRHETESFAVLAVATATLATSATPQGLPTQKVLTIDLAQTIAQEAMAKCRADGFKVSTFHALCDELCQSPASRGRRP